MKIILIELILFYSIYSQSDFIKNENTRINNNQLTKRITDSGKVEMSLNKVGATFVRKVTILSVSDSLLIDDIDENGNIEINENQLMEEVIDSSKVTIFLSSDSLLTDDIGENREMKRRGKIQKRIMIVSLISLPLVILIVQIIKISLVFNSPYFDG